MSADELSQPYDFLVEFVNGFFGEATKSYAYEEEI